MRIETFLASVIVLVGVAQAQSEEPLQARPRTEGLAFSVARPVPMGLANKAHIAEVRAELDRIRRELPMVAVLHLALELRSTKEDWMAVLDAARDCQLRVVVAFGEVREGGEDDPLRPERKGGEWQWGALAEFISDRDCASHPALLALFVVDEPWHGEKTPTYLTADLKDMYADLKSRMPDGVDVPLMVQFSRELWRRIADARNPKVSWEPGICDIVQISALEFQDGEYQHDLLDRNHSESRRILHEKTPDIPLWTSVQTMGARYGPHAGYWFPRQRDGHRDLTRLLNDVTDPEYESIHPLSGIMFQCWQSASPMRRPSQYVLGDADADARGDVPQGEAAEEAREAIRRWVYGK